jgi:phospholipase C
MNTDRRTFLQLLIINTSALSAAFPPSIARALSIPAYNRTGTINDVEHIVIMMQENRSFDHYYGTLRGVRGYGDNRTIDLPNGDPVWYQPNNDGYLLPFHPGAPNLGLQFIEDLPHDWTTTHAAWNQGKYDQWVPNKGTTTMAHLVRSDIPFHYALADAFTICDAYHCSLLGPTDPNRYYMWTGWVGNDGSGGGPVVDNAEAGYGWSTYPELLQKAGISWKIYQDIGLGLTAEQFWGFTSDAYIGNYGDNSLLYFHQYQNAPAGTPLANGAKTGTDISAGGTLFDIFRKDVASGNLPQVSWVVAPEAYTEHPNWPANYGAWYVSQILDALTDHPDVWSKTAFFMTYDENDGFFDHVVPPTVPQSRAQGLSSVDTANEIFPGSSAYAPGPYGMGIRVPMIVVSPWSKGGWVNSQVFDHTSLIRFIERRFGSQYPGVIEGNITKWRRAVSGDLTSAFNFRSPNDAMVALPSTVAYIPPDNERHPNYVPVPPTVQVLPVQEPGMRPARALPYELHVWARTDLTPGAVNIYFGNSGKVAAVYQVYSADGQSGPWTYTVAPDTELFDSWDLNSSGQTDYRFSVFGPNAFLRVFKGSIASGKANIASSLAYDIRSNGVVLGIHNRTGIACPVSVFEHYSHKKVELTLKADGQVSEFWSLERSYGWYDFRITTGSDASFRNRLAGHLETGEDSMSDPAIAAVHPEEQASLNQMATSAVKT